VASIALEEHRVTEGRRNNGEFIDEDGVEDDDDDDDDDNDDEEEHKK